MTIGEWAARLRYRYVPDHVVGEVLGRSWTDNVIPVALLIALTLYLAAAIPHFVSVGNISDTARQIGEFGLIVIGMTIVMLAGGIDLSVGSNFALANVTALALINVAKWPIEAAIAVTIGVGALVGLVNGFLIGFLRLRAFLTTLVTLTLVRAVVDLLLEVYSVKIATGDVDSSLWDYVGAGSILGVPFSFVLLIAIAIVAHFVLTRLGVGWRIMAVGGSRRAAFNAGISVPRTVFLTYVVSGVLSALAGILYASRLSGAGPDTGIGLELTAVTAALIGGNSGLAFAPMQGIHVALRQRSINERRAAILVQDCIAVCQQRFSLGQAIKPGERCPLGALGNGGAPVVGREGGGVNGSCTLRQLNRLRVLAFGVSQDRKHHLARGDIGLLIAEQSKPHGESLLEIAIGIRVFAVQRQPETDDVHHACSFRIVSMVSLAVDPKHFPHVGQSIGGVVAVVLQRGQVGQRPPDVRVVGTEQFAAHLDGLPVERFSSLEIAPIRHRHGDVFEPIGNFRVLLAEQPAIHCQRFPIEFLRFRGIPPLPE